MQLRHLETLVAIAEHGTLTAAAGHLYKTQGAVSHDLKALEGELAVQLVDRSGQRAVLTPVGEALLPHAYELLQRVDDVRRTAVALARGDAGVIRIGVLPSLSHLLAELTSEYRESNPDAEFTIHAEMRAILDDELGSGRLDLVVADSVIEEPHIHWDLLGTEPILVALPPDDQLARKKRIGPEDVSGRSFIAFDHELGSVQGATSFFSGTGHYPTPLVRSNDYRVMRQFLREGDGFAIMPASAVVGQDLALIPPDPPIERKLVAIRTSQRVYPQGVLDFYDYVVQRWPALMGELLDRGADGRRG